MNLPARQSSPSPYSIKVIDGFETGEVYPLTEQALTIGRSPENDIVFSLDPKVSRQHAVIELHGDQVLIRDITDKNFILVNGEQCKEAILQPHTRIQIGQAELELLSKASHTPQLSVTPNVDTPSPINEDEPAPISWETPSHLAQSNPTPPPAEWQDPQAYGTGQDSIPHSSPTPAKKNNRLRFYSIVFGVGGLLWFIFSPSNLKKEDPLKIRTSEEIMKETEASRKRHHAIAEARKKKGQDTRQFDEAQSSYVRCFRDYRQGQYTRAMQHCQAALSLYPQHTLAERYLRLSTRKRDEMIQFLLRKGRLQRDRGFYKMCTSTLKAVMYEIRDPKNIIFKEAKELYSECYSLGKGRY